MHEILVQSLNVSRSDLGLAKSGQATLSVYCLTEEGIYLPFAEIPLSLEALTIYKEPLSFKLLYAGHLAQSNVTTP